MGAQKEIRLHLYGKQNTYRYVWQTKHICAVMLQASLSLKISKESHNIYVCLTMNNMLIPTTSVPPTMGDAGCKSQPNLTLPLPRTEAGHV